LGIQNRALSVREAAALQSFPDDFKFVGTVSQAAKQVGNAVPVEFAKSLGEEIILSFEGR
jgi:DNA (cytosine-5)-methyltransferase 1